MILNKYSLKIYGKYSERFELEKMELISDDEVIMRYKFKTSNQQNIEKIMIINWKKADILAIIGNTNIQEQVFCWIKHCDQIFCYQKDRSTFNRKSKCRLFSKSGQLIRSVYYIDSSIHDVNSSFYNKINLQVYLNVFNKSSNKRSILILNEEFKLIQTIDEDLFNHEFPLNYSSEIRIFNKEYKMFQYTSNIAFLQLKNRKRNVHIFDKSSFYIIDCFQTKNRLITVLGDKMIFKSKSCYLIQKVLHSKPHNNQDFAEF